MNKHPTQLDRWLVALRPNKLGLGALLLMCVSLSLSTSDAQAVEQMHTHRTQIVRVGLNVSTGHLYIQLNTPVPQSNSWSNCSTNSDYLKIRLSEVSHPDGLQAMLLGAVMADKAVDFTVLSETCVNGSPTFASAYLVR